jgi:acyl carrier protein
MIPARFVQINAIPLTAAGKIDRRLLPDPGNKRPELATSFVESRTYIEQQLASIWAEVLNLDQVGIHDNFFDLGGHSLAINRVVSRVIRAFQLELPVKALFDSPTIAEMAEIITQNQARTAAPQVLERMLGEIEALSDDEAERACKGGTLR